MLTGKDGEVGMSGGSLNYFYSQLEDHAGDFDDRELDDLVKDLAQLFHDREWFLSSDTNEGSWRESRDSFKKKWFKDGARQERIEQYLADIRKDVLDSFGLSDEYCKLCKHWTKEKEPVTVDLIAAIAPISAMVIA